MPLDPDFYTCLGFPDASVASFPGMTALAVIVIFAVFVVVVMMTARSEDFGDKRVEEEASARVAVLPLNGSRRGGEVVRIGESGHISIAPRVHGDAGSLVVAFSAEIGGIDQTRPVGLQLGAEAVIRSIRAVRTWLRGFKSRMYMLFRRSIAMPSPSSTPVPPR
jgi:hypothetical protein